LLDAAAADVGQIRDEEMVEALCQRLSVVETNSCSDSAEVMKDDSTES